MVTCILENNLIFVKGFLLISIIKGVIFLLFERISTLCERKGISIAKLEKDANLGNATVRGWKKSSPSAENLKKVASVLGCTVDDLLKEN